MTINSNEQRFRAGLVQMCSGCNVEKNVSDASALVREAVASGAQYVQTPEVTSFMNLDREELLAACETQEGNSALQAFCALADELSIWLHIGSMSILLDGNSNDDSCASNPRFANRSYLIGPDGRIEAQYDKIHMFDVDLGNGESYFESNNYRPGDRAVVAKTPWGGLGMTICYDLRFAYLHRSLAKAGAKFIAVPAAFTIPTGQAHWSVLLRARAVETQCYVLAAAQGGQHEHGRATYGHSMIVSPWGDVLAEAAGDEPGVVVADVELGAVRDFRERVPSLALERAYDVCSQVSEDESLEPTR